MRPARLPLASLAIVTALACGSRTGLESPSGAAGSSSGGGSGGSGSSSGGVGIPQDPCPSAVSGPKPMFGNCSTRDGRSRVTAPTSPHVTWTAKLPTDSTGQVGLSAVSTDASGNAYVVTTGEVDESTAALRRVNGASGAIAWTTPIMPDEETTTPIVLASGGVDMFAYGKSYSDSVFTFDPATGSSTSTTFGFSLYYAPSNLAVGADGSLYVTHQDGVGTVKTTTYVSRVGPDSAVRWTSVDLATLGPTPQYNDGEISPSTIALGKDDLVVIFSYVLVKAGEVSVALAFDPATGAELWSQAIDGEVVGGPVVRADGTIVAVIDGMNGTSSLVTLKPDSGALTTLPLSMGVFQILAVTVDGVIIASADTGGSVMGLVALAEDGSVLWTSSAERATIASDCTVITFDKTIQGLDGATGMVKWDLAPPAPSECIMDAALTSAGGIVALQCDGTLFGASD